MPTLNVSLPPALAEFVDAEVASGAYSSPSDVIGDALRILHHEKEVREEKLAILRRELEIGMEDLKAGRFSDETISSILAAQQRK